MVRNLVVALSLGLAVLGINTPAHGAPVPRNLFFMHSGTLVVGPGPYIHIRMRSYIWCHPAGGEVINPLHEPCDGANADVTYDTIRIDAKLVASPRCLECQEWRMTASNDPLVYPVGKPIITSTLNGLPPGVLGVSIYHHYVLRYPASGDIVIHQADTTTGYSRTFCNAWYFAQHPPSLEAHNYFCGA